VALTHDHHSVKKGRYMYSSSFGLLTLLVNNTVLKIAEIQGNAGYFSSLLCRELGYMDGNLIKGPWLRIYRFRFSRLTSTCEDEVTESPPCFDVHVMNISERYVDYIVCIHNKYEQVRTLSE
jgi:hypothetical protein